MLGRFITIDGERIPNPNPGSFSENFPPQENVFTTEAGTQLSSVVRLDRYTWSGEFNVSSRMKASLKTLAFKPSVTCVVNGVSYSGRLRLGNIALVENSEYARNTDGLWVMNLTFEEF